LIKIIAVGKIKESYLKEAVDDYLKRISKYTKVEVIQVEDSDKEKESQLIIKNIKNKDYIILLDVNSNQLDSLEFSNKIDKLLINNPTICFIIGGSDGFSDKVYEIANEKISFSKLTFPHQLFRVILLEQIYRSYKILNNESYHK
jgi:23S rRNA (pseudouridine1915-N3)-methyltransferase